MELVLLFLLALGVSSFMPTGADEEAAAADRADAEAEPEETTEDPIVPVGTEADDTITGTAGPDQIDGQEGDDALQGGAGNDRLIGGQGDDTLSGESGGDLLEGRWGDDSLFGGTGDDTLLGQQGTDTLDGQDGDDQLVLDGADIGIGGAGVDSFVLTADTAASAMMEVRDYTDGRDMIIVQHDGAVSAPAVTVTDSGADAVVSINGAPLATVLGAAGVLTASDVSLVSAGRT